MAAATPKGQAAAFFYCFRCGHTFESDFFIAFVEPGKTTASVLLPQPPTFPAF